MKILADKRIRMVIYKIIAATLVFCLLSLCLTAFVPKAEAVCILFAGLGIVILAICCRYFREQNRIMEEASSVITEYLSGNLKARIPCEEEGELYRLFHEVNSLAAVLNAKMEKERSSREFLKNTISDISHQLKTPLAALNIYNGLLQGETENLPELNEFAVLSEKELERIETLVQNLLKIAKLDAGSVDFEKKRENLADLMKEIELRFVYRAKVEGKTLTAEGEENIFLDCDRSWMTEAVENLVKNAFDHTKEGDTVEIRWKQSASMIRVTIKDSGTGIHPEDLHHIFKRFYRSRFSQDKQGIGLGLPLAKMIVEAHGGVIEVSSTLGKGTEFILTFCPQTQDSYKIVG